MKRAKRLNGDTPSICEGEKTCAKCQITLPVGAFCRRKLATGTMSYRSQCKECDKARKQTPQGRKVVASMQRNYRMTNPDKVRNTKRKYYATEKGKACKKREDASFTVSGGRAKVEAKRLAMPLTEARRIAKLRNHTQRRANRVTDELSLFVLAEAYQLAKERKRATGFNWEVDHIKPVVLGGTNDYDNLQVVPWLWNRKKSHRRTEKFFPTH